MNSEVAPEPLRSSLALHKSHDVSQPAEPLWKGPFQGRQMETRYKVVVATCRCCNKESTAVEPTDLMAIPTKD